MGTFFPKMIVTTQKSHPGDNTKTQELERGGLSKHSFVLVFSELKLHMFKDKDKFHQPTY